MKSKIITLCLLATCIQVAQAQSIVGRASELNFNGVYGFGGDTNTPSGSVIDSALLLTDNESLGFTGSTSGIGPGNLAYAAGVEVALNHTYAITGSLASFSSITASATTHVGSSQSGVGLGQMLATNPGNGLEIYFDFAAATDYHFFGNVTTPATEVGIAQRVTLQKFDGIVWQNVFNSWTLPGQVGDFDVSGTLTSGNYRIISNTGLNVTGNEVQDSSYSYTFQAVPEPATMLLVAPALLAFARKKRKTKN